MLTGEDFDFHCHSNLVRAVAPYGLTELDVHDVLNVFQCTGLNRADKYFMRATPGEEGRPPRALRRDRSPLRALDLPRWRSLGAAVGARTRRIRSRCVAPLGVEVWKIDGAVLADWKPPQSPPLQGAHGDEAHESRVGKQVGEARRRRPSAGSSIVCRQCRRRGDDGTGRAGRRNAGADRRGGRRRPHSGNGSAGRELAPSRRTTTATASSRTATRAVTTAGQPSWHIAQAASGSWQIGFTNAGWQFAVGQDVTVTLYVDQVPYTLVLRTLSATSFATTLPDTTLIDVLRQGNMLTLLLGGVYRTFSLDGSTAAINAAALCQQQRSVAPPPVAPPGRSAGSAASRGEPPPALPPLPAATSAPPPRRQRPQRAACRPRSRRKSPTCRAIAR